MSWSLVYTKQAQKDAKKLTASGLKNKATELLKVIESRNVVKVLRLWTHYE